jgi:hypothetical protein
VSRGAHGQSGSCDRYGERSDIDALAGSNLQHGARGGYTQIMIAHRTLPRQSAMAIKPSPRTLHSELLRLCARIGYSPPFAG